METETSAPATEPEKKTAWFDAACALLMAIASLTTAWSTYQNSRWSGQTADLSSRADTLEREAMTLVLESQQFEAAQLGLVMQAVNALLDGNSTRAAFYTERFPPELKSAWEKWIAMKPFENAAAPPHPFVPSLYQPRFTEEIRTKSAEAGKLSAQSKVTGKNAAGYLSNTVIFATVLFFAGTAGKFDDRRIRHTSLAFAVALFLFGAMRTLLLPLA
jgi:hypothetical protein